MRIKHSTGAAALVHEGRTFEPEDDGYFRVPFDLAQSLLRRPEWEAEPAVVVVPELPAVDPEPATDPDPEPNPDDLTPAQKAAITRAANKAAAEAEAAK